MIPFQPSISCSIDYLDSFSPFCFDLEVDNFFAINMTLIVHADFILNSISHYHGFMFIVH